MRRGGAVLALLRIALPLAALLWAGGATAQPRIAIILDDMGNGLNEGRRALALPGQITYSFLPRTPHARTLAEAAHRLGREVMLHLPMEPRERSKLDPGAITSSMSETQLAAVLRAGLAAVPHARGVNNHQGSLLTTRAEPMQWLMRGLKERGELFFVDSRTSDRSVAWHTAAGTGLPTLRRDIFLDHDPQPAAITAQFDRLIGTARAAGAALAIGHPHPHTLAVLERVLPELAAREVELVSVSTLIADHQEGRVKLWQASLSPSPRGAKSSKR